MCACVCVCVHVIYMCYTFIGMRACVCVCVHIILVFFISTSSYIHISIHMCVRVSMYTYL